MGKVEITRTEAIPFREEDNSIMQMKQYEITVKVSQGDNETVEDIEKELDIVFNRNLQKTMDKDPIYIRKNKQLNALVNKIKELAPTKVKQIVNEIRKI